MINDVRGGREEGMITTMADLGVPVILMHSRGDSVTMTQGDMQDYSQYGHSHNHGCDGVVEGVKVELGKTVSQALENGVRAWDIILDPGIGFAKTPSQSIDLLRHISELGRLALPGVKGESSSFEYPVLVGASRKGFVGKITGRQEASERGWGDAVVNSFCAGRGRGVGILRVHDWKGAKESIRMVKALEG
jgi:dihydroneopterin aldolase/2-amino-4-hydroxy-6-hydroxymethyldihydropteridine diphosphokinase/dihydropteroate synthase